MGKLVVRISNPEYGDWDINPVDVNVVRRVEFTVNFNLTNQPAENRILKPLFGQVGSIDLRAVYGYEELGDLLGKIKNYADPSFSNTSTMYLCDEDCATSIVASYSGRVAEASISVSESMRVLLKIRFEIGR